MAATTTDLDYLSVCNTKEHTRFHPVTVSACWLCRRSWDLYCGSAAAPYKGSLILTMCMLVMMEGFTDAQDHVTILWRAYFQYSSTSLLSVLQHKHALLL